MLLFTNIDRLWVEYSSDTWNVRAGRQRINWGISTTWNPNDLFNTYNFLDFDYEERPACDAVKFHYEFSGMSFAEFAFSRSAEPVNNVIAAGRYFINRWNYDFQFLGGWYRDQPTLGAGWSGSIGNVGFPASSGSYRSAECFGRSRLYLQFRMVHQRWRTVQQPRIG